MEIQDSQSAAPGENASIARPTSTFQKAIEKAFGVENAGRLLLSYEDIAKSWLSGGCSYCNIVHHPLQKDIIEKVDRKTIISMTPEVRAMTLAISLIYSPNFGEICRMIYTANEADRVDNFEYYSKILWLLYSQSNSFLVQAKITLALEMAPDTHIEQLYCQEFDAMGKMEYPPENERRPISSGFFEAKKFSDLCFELMTREAKTVLSEQAFLSPCDLEEAISVFNLKPTTYKKEELELVA
jgi:hypothetical protein